MKIVTDSAADLLPAEIDELGITVAPLYIQFPEGEVRSEDLTPDAFYTRLEEMQPAIPTTTLPSPGVFAELYQQLASEDEEILSIHISSGLSGTYNAALQGAEQSGRNVTVVDTMTLSGGQRFQVLAAAQAAHLGQSKEAILEKLARIRQATEVIYTLDTLKYLQRGGRIGRVQALAGSLLNIKPLIHVSKEDGRYSTAGRARTLSKALHAIADHLVQAFGQDTPLWVSVVHGKFATYANTLQELVSERLRIARTEVLRISPVLGVHTGPGIVGVTAVPMALMENPG